jgi:hypothetical protein
MHSSYFPSNNPGNVRKTEWKGQGNNPVTHFGNNPVSNPTPSTSMAVAPVPMDIDRMDSKGKGPSLPPTCYNCKQEGHLAQNCPHCLIQEVYKGVSLYEWIQCHEKVAMSKKEKADFIQDLLQQEHWAEFLGDSNLDTDMSSDSGLSFVVHDSDSTSCNPSEEAHLEDQEWSYSDDDNTLLKKQKQMDDDIDTNWYSFLKDHQQYQSHKVHCDFGKMCTIVPNFIGGAVFPTLIKGIVNTTVCP